MLLEISDFSVVDAVAGLYFVQKDENEVFSSSDIELTPLPH